MDQKNIDAIKHFVSREDLEGTDLKLKEATIDIDRKLSMTIAEIEKIQKQLNEKQMIVMSLSQKLEGMCDLILQLSDTNEDHLEEPE